MLQKVLLESEAAELLRRAPSYIKRMRLERRLSYYKGRPVTISEKDLQIFVASAKVRRFRLPQVEIKRNVEPTRPTPQFYYAPENAAVRPFKLLTIKEAAEKFERKPRAIRYLCMAGHIPYILGRPPLIDESDLASYLEARRKAREKFTPPPADTPEGRAFIEARARKKIRLRRLRQSMAGIMRDIAARKAAGTYKPGGLSKRKPRKK
ncbi:helix-turn-helix domain-containing protein [Bradyrhizobium lablabi]|uniref:helix-turn-helix domain-containing protein n=1 Tax=Bradyrhizobium lablabi TaxID=722472 RepID=UPI001BAB19B2|nr:helix-turn-helix domain-containing protein [Bradyrhizobium lablabi]MBR1124520.1 helix-turn-helix domain-containing protein [Bradyrhizobium lablabi]